MALAVYDGELYLDNEAWIQIVLMDRIDGSIHEVVLDNDGFIVLEDSILGLTDYDMFDPVTGVYWALFVQDNVLGMAIVESGVINVGDGFGNMYFKIGAEIIIKILNKDSTQEASDINLKLIDEDTWEFHDVTFNDITELEVGVYTSSVTIYNPGDYTLITKLPRYGNMTTHIKVLDKTIVDFNQRLEFLSKEMTALYSIGY